MKWISPDKAVDGGTVKAMVRKAPDFKRAKLTNLASPEPGCKCHQCEDNQGLLNLKAPGKPHYDLLCLKGVYKKEEE